MGITISTIKTINQEDVRNFVRNCKETECHSFLWEGGVRLLDDKSASILIRRFPKTEKEIQKYKINQKANRRKIEEDPRNIKDIDPFYLDLDTCINTCKKIVDKGISYPLSYIPDQFLDETFYNKIKDYSTELLKDLPEQYITKKMCQKLLKENPEQFEGIFHCIPFPDLCYEYLMKQPPQKLYSLMDNIHSNAVTDQLINDITDKDIGLLYICILGDLPIPYDTYLKGYYHSGFNHLDKGFLEINGYIPPMHLIAYKLGDEQINEIPGEVRNRKNIFSFAINVEDKLKRSLPLKQLFDLYNGKKIVLQPRDKKYSSSQVIHWDKDKNVLQCQPFYSLSGILSFLNKEPDKQRVNHYL